MKQRLLKFRKYNRFALIVAIFALLISESLPAYAAEGGSCGSNLKWNLSDGTLTISGKGEMTDYGNGVMAPWYGMEEEIYAVSLPSGLTSIGDFAFYGCKNLTNVTVPSSVTSIGDYAFAECTGLLQVRLGSVQTIGDGAFQQCEALTSISFPTSLTSIGTKAFYRCYGLRTVTIPSSVTALGVSVFGYCEGLVRATINAPIDTLPVWTFYGCSNLTDVSLAPQITSVGEYAFQHCENLNGVYVQSGDENVASKIEQSINEDNRNKNEGAVSQEDVTVEENDESVDQSTEQAESTVDPFVATHGMPNSSTVTSNGEEFYTSITVVQKDGLSITIKEVTGYANGSITTDITIEATVENSEEWASVAEVVDEELASVKNGDITVEIQLVGTTVEADELMQYAGKPITLKIKLANGIVWKLDMSKFSEKDFSGTYELGATILKVETGKTTIGSETVYSMKFDGNVNFNVTVGINLGNLNDRASLFVKEGSSYELINTMLIDQDSYAWFSLAGVGKNTKYYIGMNVEKITAEDATIPETMYGEYDLEDNGAYLMDENGVQYRITGRSSRWGITGKQFAIYVGVAIAAAVLIVGFVMITLNIIKKSKEKYECMAEEEALKEQAEEEALRMEIMKELLGESDDSIRKE